MGKIFRLNFDCKKKSKSRAPHHFQIGVDVFNGDWLWKKKNKNNKKKER